MKCPIKCGSRLCGCSLRFGRYCRERPAEMAGGLSNAFREDMGEEAGSGQERTKRNAILGSMIQECQSEQGIYPLLASLKTGVTTQQVCAFTAQTVPK